MKKIYLSSIVVAVFAILFIGCETAEYDVKQNSLYIADAATSSKATTVSMEVTGADINIIVRLARKTERAVEVGITMNPSSRM